MIAASPSSIIDNGSKFLLHSWSKAVEVRFYIGSCSREVRLIGAIPNTHNSRTINDPMVGAPYTIYENGEFRCGTYLTNGSAFLMGLPNIVTLSNRQFQMTVLNGRRTTNFVLITLRINCRPVVFKLMNNMKCGLHIGAGKHLPVGRFPRWGDGLHDYPLGIDVSDDGWDSQMICYAHPLKHEHKQYALYNGNNYGATGVGLAAYE